MCPRKETDPGKLKARFEQFFERRDPLACWPWVGGFRGGRNDKGYGQINLGGKRFNAHKAAYLLYKGDVPEGLHVLHRCDNKSCVNPNHLELGSNADNHKQAWERDRFKSRRKLSPKDILEVRSSDLSKKVLARHFNVHLSHIYQICYRVQGGGILRMPLV